MQHLGSLFAEQVNGVDKESLVPLVQSFIKMREAAFLFIGCVWDPSPHRAMALTEEQRKTYR